MNFPIQVFLPDEETAAKAAAVFVLNENNLDHTMIRIMMFTAICART